MARKTPPMRTLNSIDSVRIGDVIRISGKIGDMQISRVGKVNKRDISQMGTDLLTERGMSLVTVFRDGTTGIQNVKIQLLTRVAEPTLF